MSHHTLITAQDLQTLIEQGQPLLLLDLSCDLTDRQAGRRLHEQGHIPGSHFLDLETELSGPKTGRNGRHPLPDRDAFAARLHALGWAPGMQVICYDGQAAMFAARAWWMLRWLGHAEVAVLDGGLSAWRAAGGPISAGTTPAPSITMPLPPLGTALTHQIDADALQSRQGRVRLMDARAAERFRGEVEPLDAQAGHIPGAINRCFKDNLQTNGSFKPADQLRQEFLTLLGPFEASDCVQQCGSGVTACVNLLAMAHAGLDGAMLYPGSWSEWSSDPARPVARSTPANRPT